MKISELPGVASTRRDMIIPISVAKVNRGLTLGQILDAVSASIVKFSEIREADPDAQYALGSPTQEFRGRIIFDKATNRFYHGIATFTNAGQLVAHWTYYRTWSNSAEFFDEQGEVRTDCLFSDDEHSLYCFDGANLVRTGLTDEQARQIRLSTPLEVNDEEEMERRIAAGEYEDGQIYYTTQKE